MKRLIVLLLLVIVSAQGLGAAAGIIVLDASRALACLENTTMRGDASPSIAASEDGDTDGLKIFSIAEELSDYVALEPGMTSLRYQAPSISTAASIPASIVLPRFLPPPRS